MKYSIKYTTNPPSKIFEINKAEEEFFNALYLKLSKEINKGIHLIRMANGTITVDYYGYFIGKIKLQGKKHDMLILTSLGNSYIAYDNFIKHIDEWVNYINKYIIKE